MPNLTTKFYLERNETFESGDAVAYFDITGVQNSYSTINSVDWANLYDIKLNVNKTGNFWQESGAGFLDGNNFIQISGLDNPFISNRLSFLFAYQLESIKNDTVFLSSLDNKNGDWSGVNFGVNKYGFPYIEYYSRLYGPISFCSNLKANNTGILLCEIGLDFYSVGFYIPINKYFYKNTIKYDIDDVVKNYNFNIGSGNYIDGKFSTFSGKLDEIFICSPRNLDEALFELSFLTGVSYSLVDQVYSGVISGQTGVLNGDIIELQNCYFAPEQEIFYQQLSGSGEYLYFASSGDFIDFNGEIYTQYVQQQTQANIVSGIFLGTGIAQVCESISAYNFFQYDSGYKIEYKITNKLANLLSYKYITYYINNLIFKDYVSEADYVFYLGSAGGDEDFINLKEFFKQENNSLYLYEQFQSFSGLYRNGQLQTISNLLDLTIASGEKFYYPQRDYFISGFNVFLNESPLFNNFIIDLWPPANYIETGYIASGTNLNIDNLNNKLLFLNGQLLLPNLDYNSSGKITFNVPSGYNVISTQYVNPNKFITGAIPFESTGFSFKINDVSYNTSSVWLNGLRLSINDDYSENIIDDKKIDIFLKQDGKIVYRM